MITKAKVQLTLEVDVSGTWGPECTMKQVYEQAREGAVGNINNALYKSTDTMKRSIRIVGTPSILAITTEQRE